MGRIGDCFDRLRGAGEKALVPFVTAGDPDLDTRAYNQTWNQGRRPTWISRSSSTETNT